MISRFENSASNKQNGVLCNSSRSSGGAFSQICGNLLFPCISTSINFLHLNVLSCSHLAFASHFTAIQLLIHNIALLSLHIH